MKMRKFRILLVFCTCVLLLSGCGNKANQKSSEIANKKEITTNYIYNNEPKFTIAQRIGNKVLYGFIDKSGKEVVKPKYYAVGLYNDGVAMVTEYKDNQLFYGLIDSLGNTILPSEYDGITYFSEDLAVVKSAGKSGYANKKGKFIIYPKYDFGYVFKEGIAKVIVEGKVGFINKKGEYIIYPKYDKTDNIADITGFIGGFTIIKSNGKYSIINKTGAIIKTLDFDSVVDFTKDKYKVSKNKKYGLINASGNIVLETKYNSLKSLDKDGKFIAFSNSENKYGVMDKSLKEIIPAKYSNNVFYGDGIITTYDNADNKTLLFDSKGKLLAKSDYKLKGGFSNELCLVETQDSIYQGYINKKAEIIIPLKYSKATDYKDGLAFVMETKADEVIVGYIDTKGNYIWKTNTLFTPEELIQVKSGQSASKPKEVAKKTTVSNTKRKYSNNNSGYYNNYYYYDDYDNYSYGNYSKPSKSQDFVDAENDILN